LFLISSIERVGIGWVGIDDAVEKVARLGAEIEVGG
jgi:hypothetical protein